MSPSSAGTNAIYRSKLCVVLVFSVFSCVSFAQCCDRQSPSATQSELFLSFRQFDEVPDVGVTYNGNGNEDIDDYLIFDEVGETEEIEYTFSFLPPTGSATTDYDISFSCDDPLVHSSSMCNVTENDVAIENSTLRALNISVICVFDKFPGTTDCDLQATSNSDTTTGLTEYSASVRVVIYGYVFYLPDDDGQMSNTSTIVSGTDNSFALELFDRKDEGIREIETYLYFPANITGSAGSFDFLNDADIAVDYSDAIVWYKESCSVFNAAFDSGEFALSDSSTCGMGLAIRNESSFPTLGINFRPYKSGNLTLSISWDPFGTLAVGYKQIMILNIIETAPPVIFEISKEDEYLSTPCDTRETLNMTVMNIQGATANELRFPSLDEQLPWNEQNNSYSSEEDVSIVSFKSSGGLGTDVSFDFISMFNGFEERKGVQLIDDIETIESFNVSFSLPPTLASMTPQFVNESGGEIVTLEGSFSGLQGSDGVLVGGTKIRISDANMTGTTGISFFAPAREGSLFVYPVLVERCAEKSNSIELTYIAYPSILGIDAVGASYNEQTGLYLFPSGDSNLTFIADTAGNFNGLSYSWEINTADGSSVPLSGGIPSDIRRFSLPESFFSSSQSYTLSLTVENVLELAVTDSLRFQIDGSNSDFIAVKVFESRTDLTRVADVPTFVQARLTTNVLTAVNLTWSYNGTLYPANIDTDSTDEIEVLATGPTKLGLEFYIEREDLIIGETTISLTATAVSDPGLTDTDSAIIEVKQADLEAIINNGINGTLVKTTDEGVTLSGENSTDADSIADGADPNAGIQYSWNWCFKSYFSNFDLQQNCSSLLPADRTVPSFTVSSSDLLVERLDQSGESTFFSFGVEVSKDTRTAFAFLYFEFKTIEDSAAETETAPTLSSINIVDIGGNPIPSSDLYIQREIIILPVANDTTLQWEYDMQAGEQYVFLTGSQSNGTDGFVSGLNQLSRLGLAFAPNTLDPGKEYVVDILLSYLTPSSLVTTLQVKFETAENSALSCEGPPFSEGVISETEIEIYANSSYNSQSLEYCFYLIDEDSQRYIAGRGCSSVPSVMFTFPQAGVYDIFCALKTITGVQLAEQRLDVNLTLTLPPETDGKTQVEVLQDRLSKLNETLISCEALRDHGCILSLGIELQNLSGAIGTAIDEATDDDDLTALNDLKDAASDTLQTIAALINTVAQNTVFKINAVEDAIQTSLLLTLAGGNLFSDINTLYDSISLMDAGMSFLKSNSTVALQSDTLVDEIIAATNVTLTKAVNIDDEGTTRRRLLQNRERVAYGSLLIRILNNVALARRQQETCGYIGVETTIYPSTMITRSSGFGTGDSLSPSVINIIIACDSEWLSDKKLGTFVESSFCMEGFSAVENTRLEMVLIEIRTDDLLMTGMVSDIDVYTEYVAYIELNGIRATGLPSNCITVEFDRKPETVVPTTSFTRQSSGVVGPYPEERDQFCSKETCFNFKESEGNENSFETSIIRIKTANEGVVTAGNYTKSILVFVITGHGYTILGAFLRILMPTVLFAAVAAVAAWVSVTTGVITYPEVDDLGWEYVERDMFGRGSVEAGNITPAPNTSTTVGSTFTNMASTQAMEKRASTRAL